MKTKTWIILSNEAMARRGTQAKHKWVPLELGQTLELPMALAEL